MQLHDIHEDPAFAWWFPFKENKRKTIISKLEPKYWQRTYKYVIRIPKFVNEAYVFDKEKGNKSWTEVINEEMNKVRIAVQESNVSPDKLFVYQEIGLQMIFISIRTIISDARPKW